MNSRDKGLLESTARAEGFPVEHADKYMCVLQGKVFVLTAGLLYKLEQKFPGGWFVRSELPSAEEHALVCDMTGIDQIAVMRGVVEVKVDGETHTYEDFGTCHAGNAKGFVSMQTYPIELASRRATNRAMRLAVQTGVTSLDETDGVQMDGQRRPQSPPQRTPQTQAGKYPANASATKNDIATYMHKLLGAHKDGVLDDEEYAAGKAIADNPRGVLKTVLDKALDRLQARVDQFEAAQEGGD